MRFLRMAAAAVVFMALAARADPPPGLAGWGVNGNETIYATPFATQALVWDFEGNDWVQNRTPLDGEGDWPNLSVLLWTEIECLYEWDETEVDIHRTSNYADVCVYFHGHSRCNSWTRIAVIPNGVNLNYLKWWGDGFGNGQNPAYNIPLKWAVREGGDDWCRLYPNPSLCFGIGRCDQDYTLRCCLDLRYHQPDGYYSFTNTPGESPVILTAFPVRHL